MKREEEIKYLIQDVWEDYRYKGYEAFEEVALKLINWADEHPAETEEATKLDDITTREGFYRAFQKHKFKPFDKVLVRDNQTQEWVCTLLSSVKDDGDYPIYLSICNYPWLECIPYEGNEHLVGTTKNPK